MAKSKMAPFSISPALQRLFVFSALAAAIVPMTYQMYMAATQYASNPNLSAYYWIMLYGILSPILFFIVAYMFNDKNKPASGRIFFSVFLATCGMMTLVALDTVVSQSLAALSIAFSDAFWGWFWLQMGMVAIVTVAYATLLAVLKRFKKL